MSRKLIFTILIILIPIVIFAQEIDEKGAFLMAKNAYDDESYGVALDLLYRFVDKFPNSLALPEAQLYIAECLYRKDKFIEARDILTKLEKTQVPLGIQDRFLFLLGEAYLKVKDFKQAGEYFKKLIETHPNSDLLASTNMQLGLLFFQDERYQEANEIFDVLMKSRDISIREEAFFKKGEALYNMKDYKRLLEHYGVFTNVFRDSDKLAKVYFYMGEASFYSGDFAKAVEIYSSAAEKTDDDLLKIMSLQGMGWSYLKQNKFKEAEDAFLRVDGFGNQDFNKESLFFGKATLFYLSNKLDQALVYYDKLIESYPQSDAAIQALFQKAECLSGLSRFDEAIGLYKEFIERGVPRNNDNIQSAMNKAYYNLGWAYFKTGNFSYAIKEFQNAVLFSKDKEVKLSALYQIGDIHQNNQEFDGAEETYSKILKDYPENSNNDYALYQLGLIQFKSGKIDSAILTFRNFNKSFSQSEFLDDVNYYLGYAYFENNQMPDASQQFKKFLEAFSNSLYCDTAVYLLAVSFYNRGMFKEAIDNFEWILKEFGQNKDLTEKAEYEIASALYQAGDKKSAIKKFRQFIDNYPKSEITPDIIFWLGQYYYQGSEYELARRSFEMIVRMYPKYKLVQEAKYEIGLTFLAEARAENAMQTFSRLLLESDSQQIKLKTMLAVGDLLVEQNKATQAAQMYKSLLNLALSGNTDSLASQLKNESSNRNIEFNNFLDYTNKSHTAEKSAILADKTSDEENDISSINKIVKTAYVKLGDLYKKNNNFTDAINKYREAIKYVLNESYAELQFKIAECLEEENRLDTAIEEYSRIPNFTEQDKIWVVKGLLRSARIYEYKEDRQKAIETYKKIINYDVPETKYAKDRIEEINKPR